MRRGWYLGTDDFRDRILDAVADVLRAKRRKGSITGMAARAHDKAEAERLVKAAADMLGMPTARKSLAGRGLYADEKTLIAWLVRKRTSVTRDWVTERLEMGHPSSVSRAVRKVPNSAGRRNVWTRQSSNVRLHGLTPLTLML